MLLLVAVVVIGIVACAQPGPTTAALDAQQPASSDGAALEAVAAQRDSSTTCELGNCSDASSEGVDPGRVIPRCPETIPVHETECAPFVRCAYANVHCYCSAQSTWQCHPFLPAGTDQPPHDIPVGGDAGNAQDVNPTQAAPPTAAPSSTAPNWRCDAGPITDAATSLDARPDAEPERNPPDASVSLLDASYDSGTKGGSDGSSFTSDRDTLRSAIPRH